VPRALQFVSPGEPPKPALGSHSHAVGTCSFAVGARSHAVGWRSPAVGARSHAVGSRFPAVGWRSHAVGSRSHDAGWRSQGRFEPFQGFWPPERVASDIYEQRPVGMAMIHAPRWGAGRSGPAPVGAPRRRSFPPATFRRASSAGTGRLPFQRKQRRT